MSTPVAMDVRLIEERELAAAPGTVFSGSRRSGTKAANITANIDLGSGFKKSVYVGGGGEGSVFATSDANGNPIAVKISATKQSVGWSQAHIESPWGDRASPTSGIPVPSHAAVWERQESARIAGLAGLATDQPVLIGKLYAGTLADELSRGRAFSDERIAQVTSRLCIPLIQSNLVHRDIKPENIFVDVNGDVALGDWGLAARAGTPVGVGCTETYASDTQLRHLDQWKAAKGTKPTMPANPRWDAYSIGLVVAEMATGKTVRQDMFGVLSADDQAAVEQTWRNASGVTATGSAYLDLVVAESCRPNATGAEPIDILAAMYPMLPAKDRMGPQAIVTPDLRRRIAERTVQRARAWQDAGWKRAQWEQDHPNTVYPGAAPLSRALTMATAAALLADAQGPARDQAVTEMMTSTTDMLANSDPQVLMKVREIAQDERSEAFQRAQIEDRQRQAEVQKLLRMRGSSRAETEMAVAAVPSASPEPLLVAPVARRQIPADQQKTADMWALNRAMASRAARPPPAPAPQHLAPPPGFTPSPPPPKVKGMTI